MRWGDRSALEAYDIITQHGSGDTGRRSVTVHPDALALIAAAAECVIEAASEASVANVLAGLGADSDEHDTAVHVDVVATDELAAPGEVLVPGRIRAVEVREGGSELDVELENAPRVRVFADESLAVDASVMLAVTPHRIASR